VNVQCCRDAKPILQQQTTLRTESANTPTGTLTGLSFNARSIVNKLDVLPLLIHHYNPKLILVTESRFSN